MQDPANISEEPEEEKPLPEETKQVSPKLDT